MDPISTTSGVSSHGVSPVWLMSLVCGLSLLESLISNVQVLAHHQWWTFTFYLAELRGALTGFMGAIGDYDHYLWMTSFSVSMDVQYAAPAEEEVLKDEVLHAFLALRTWVEDQPDAVVDSTRRKLSAVISALDVGTDIEVKVSSLAHILDEAENTASFLAVIRQERKQARFINPVYMADDDAEDDADDEHPEQDD